MTLRLSGIHSWLLLLSLAVALAAAPRAYTEEHVLARLDTVTESADRVREERAPRDHAALLSTLGELDANIQKATTRITALESTVSEHTGKLDLLRDKINTGRNLSDTEQSP